MLEILVVHFPGWIDVGNKCFTTFAFGFCNVIVGFGVGGLGVGEK